MAKDSYQVLGQGLSGMIEPYSVNNLSLFSKEIKNRSHLYNSHPKKVDIKHKLYNLSNRSLPFRFKGDFANSYAIQPNSETYFGQESAPPFNPTYTSGKNYNPVFPDPYGIDGDEIRGSKKIQEYQTWRLNDRYNRVGLMMDFKDSKSTSHHTLVTGNRGENTYELDNQIGAFKVVKEDGLTYHYAKALYSSDYQNITFDKSKGTSIRTVENKQPYAHAWLLTGITGPDFVDRGGGANGTDPNGYLDENDWGYWVGFSYGKPSTSYIWRIPYTGYDGDLAGSHYYSAGRRQQAYLKAVYTQSHTALFIQKQRVDARGANSLSGGGKGRTSAYSYGLEKVLLLKNESLLENGNDIAEAIQNISESAELNSQTLYSKDLLTQEDLNQLPTNIYDQKVRGVDFGYDYMLVPGTPNSGSGKLTLKQVNFLAKGAARNVIPPITFDYEDEEMRGQGKINYFSRFTITSGEQPNVGDILRLSNGAYVIVKDISGTLGIEKIGDRALPAQDVLVTWEVTKNPWYYEDNFDAWGYFKADYYNPNEDDQNIDYHRRTSALSAYATDVWSLRKIRTQLGSTINVEYESDNYESDGLSSPKIINFQPGYQVKLLDDAGNHIWFGSDSYWNDNDEYKFSLNLYSKLKDEGYRFPSPYEVRFKTRES
ncbi:MAG: hypothetical protein AAFO69_16945, partial [Bacteroidota bacterium]